MIPLLGLTLYTYMIEQEQVISHIRQDVLRIAKFAAGDQEQVIERTRQLLVAISKIPEVNDREPKSCSATMRDILAEYLRYSNIGAVNHEGKLFCAAYRSDEEFDFRHQPWFLHSIETKDFAIGIMEDEGTLNVSYPKIDSDGNVESVIFAALGVDQLNQLAHQLQLPAKAEFFMVTRTGTLLAHLPEHEKMVGTSLQGTSIFSAILDKGQDVAEIQGVDGTVRLYAFTPLSSVVDTGLYIGVGIPRWAAYNEAKKVLMHHFIGLGMGIFWALLAVWFGSDMLILERVRALVRAAGLLSRGDMSARSGLPKGSGELDGLARAFDEMAEALEQRAQELREAEAKYRTLVEQIPIITYAANLDATRSTFYISPQIEEVLGFSTQEWLANPAIWFKQIHPEDMQKVKTALDAIRRAASGTSFSCEYRIFTKEGQQLWFNDEATKFYAETTEDIYLRGIMRDITSQKHSQEQLVTYQRQLRSLASQLSLAEERERRRIAAELHDHVGQALAMSRIKLGLLKESVPNATIAAKVSEIRNLVVQAIHDTRGLIFKISSPILYELGFEAALEWLAEETQKKYEIKVIYQNDGKQKVMDEDVQVLLFQAVGELLVNVVKHAQAQIVKLSTSSDGKVIKVEVKDDGVGFDAVKTNAKKSNITGFGLFSIRERLRHVDGRMEINSTPGEGARVTLLAPLKARF